jgi:hypothetical protein
MSVAATKTATLPANAGGVKRGRQDSSATSETVVSSSTNVSDLNNYVTLYQTRVKLHGVSDVKQSYMSAGPLQTTRLSALSASECVVVSGSTPYLIRGTFSPIDETKTTRGIPKCVSNPIPFRDMSVNEIGLDTPVSHEIQSVDTVRVSDGKIVMCHLICLSGVLSVCLSVCRDLFCHVIYWSASVSVCLTRSFCLCLSLSLSVSLSVSVSVSLSD